MELLKSTHRWHILVTIQFVCLALLSCSVVSARELLQVALLHRHGARTEPFVSDEGLNWDSCVLSDTGVEMALSLGRFTRARYNTLLPIAYDQRVVVSLSTDFERTVRTAVGVLRGMYNETNEIPFVAHKPQDIDFLMGFYYSWPSAVLAGDYIREYNAANDNVTLSFFPQEKLDVIGETLNCRIICKTEQTMCALLGEDVSTCRLSNGGISSNLTNLFPLMFEAQERSNAFLYLYNDSDTYWRNTGPYGRLLAVEIFDTFASTLSAHQNDSNATPLQKLYHYSAHDVTIYSFFTAIGAITYQTQQEDILVPTFASAVFLELYGDGNVTISFYECNQTFGSSYAYAEVDNVFLGCKASPPRGMNDTSGVYYATNCPLEHFKNFVDLKAPPPDAFNGAPWCYQDPQYVAMNGCYPNTSATPSPDCKTYRKICPEYSCDTANGFVLNRVTYTCDRLFGEASSSTGRHSLAVYIGVPLCSLAIGAVLGMAIRFMVFERKAKQQTEHPALLP